MSSAWYIWVLLLIIAIDSFWTSRSSWFVELANFAFGFVLLSRAVLPIYKSNLFVLELYDNWLVDNNLLFRVRLRALVSSRIVIRSELLRVKVNIRSNPFPIITLFALAHYILSTISLDAHPFLVDLSLVIDRALHKRLSLICFQWKLYLISVKNDLVSLFGLTLNSFIELCIVECLVCLILVYSISGVLLLIDLSHSCYPLLIYKVLLSFDMLLMLWSHVSFNRSLWTCSTVLLLLLPGKLICIVHIGSFELFFYLFLIYL